MKYLIVQDWPSTHGNHAGMVHMCNLLAAKFPDEYTVIVKEQQRKFSQTSNWLLRKLVGMQARYYSRHVFVREYKKLCKQMFQDLKDGDKVFLLEYMFPYASQLEIAVHIHQKFPNVKVYGLCHLTRSFFKDERIYPDLLKTWPQYTTKLLTFGHSLTDYFVENGVPSDMVSTGRHYVDDEYYHVDAVRDCLTGCLRALVMGSMQRDYGFLADIVFSTPNIQWIICRGRNASVDRMFDGCKNVTLKGFLLEVELRRLMHESDVSVNIMADTIGSNVITTSLAMGMAMVCSDVGSIRDYCNDENSLFCENTPESFIDALKKLDSDRKLVMAMKAHSLRQAELINIQSIHRWFNSL